MKRIIVTGAGGTPSTNFVRSLRSAPEPFHLVGVDANKYYLQRAETDERYLVPSAEEADYIPILNSIIDETRVEFIHAQPDYEVYAISRNRNHLHAETFLPKHSVVEACQDKLKSNQIWEKAGLKVPKAMKIDKPKDIERAFDSLGSSLWIRAIVSPGAGKGSLKVNKASLAKEWIDFQKGWGNFMASQRLTDQTVTWMSIWKEGELVVAQGRRRLYWELASRAPSGVTGLTGAGVTIADNQADKIAEEAIIALDHHPNGIYSVDMTYDHQGVPNPTEINIGRFFTTHFFFTTAGLNMPYLYVKLAYAEGIPKLTKKVNPLTPGLCWIRGMDFLPVLTDLNHVQLYEDELKKRTLSMAKKS